MRPIRGKRQARRGCALVGVAFLCAAAGAEPARISVTVEKDAISVAATDAPLREVLEVIASRCNIEIASTQPLRRQVTLALDGRPLNSLIRSLLRDESFIFVDVSAEGWQRSRLWIIGPAGTDTTYEWRIGDDSPGGLDQALVEVGSLDSERRVRALAALAVLGGEHASLAAVSALSDPAAAVREEAVYAVGSIDGAEAAGQLAQSLQDPSQSVREAAVTTLAELGGPEAMAALEQSLASGDEALRMSVVEEMADIDDAWATDLLQRAARDAAPQVADAAARNLAERNVTTVARGRHGKTGR